MTQLVGSTQEGVVLPMDNDDVTQWPDPLSPSPSLMDNLTNLTNLTNVNATLLEDWLICPPLPSDDDTGHEHRFPPKRVVLTILDQYVTPTLCTLGLLGNLINLAVLSRRRFRRCEGSREGEGTAHLGLLLLALSDLLFCIVLFPKAFIRATRSIFPSKGWRLFYQMYGNGLINTFISCSTWLTVALATFRFLGICHPFRARLLTDRYMTPHLIYIMVFVCSITFNLPWFWYYQVVVFPCLRHSSSNDVTGAPTVNISSQLIHYYIMDIGYFDHRKPFGLAFQWFRLLLNIVLPAFLLVFCNFSLILALRQSYQLRREHSVKQQLQTASRVKNRITLTLVIIAMTFIVLVLPCELLDCLSDYLYSGTDTTRNENFLVARSVANVLQVVNFAFNFLLYCAINAHFRSALTDLCNCRKEDMGGARVARTHCVPLTNSNIQYNSMRLHSVKVCVAATNVTRNPTTSV